MLLHERTRPPLHLPSEPGRRSKSRSPRCREAGPNAKSNGTARRTWCCRCMKRGWEPNTVCSRCGRWTRRCATSPPDGSEFCSRWARLASSGAVVRHGSPRVPYPSRCASSSPSCRWRTGQPVSQRNIASQAAGELHLLAETFNRVAAAERDRGWSWRRRKSPRKSANRRRANSWPISAMNCARP